MPADSTSADSAARPGTASVSPVEAAPDAVQHLLHALPWGALQLTAAGTVARLNPAAQALWGVPAAAVLGRAPADVQPAVLPPALLHALAALPADAPTTPLWLPHTGQWVQLRAAPAPEGGQWVYWETVAAPPPAAPAADVAQLLASHELLQRTIDSSLDLVQVFRAVRDEQGRVVDFEWVLNNAAAERAYGDVIGRRLCQLNPGVIEAGIFDTFRQVLETGVPDQLERHYVHEQFDGWFLQSTVKLDDGVTTTTHDITARKRMEQELRQSRSLLQDIIDAPNIGLAVYRAVRDAAGVIVDFRHEYINRASLTMLAEDFTGKLFTDHGENGRRQLPQLIEVMESGRGNRYLRQVEFRGRQAWFAITNTPLDGDRLVHSWEDVTERQQTEQEILRLKEEIAQQATDKYYTLFTAMDEGYCIIEVFFDAAGQPYNWRFLEVNPAFEHNNGLTNATGKTILELTPNIEPKWFDIYGRVAQTGEPLRFEEHSAALGRWFSLYAFPIGRAEDHQVAVIFSDITVRKNAEEALRRVAVATAFRLRLADALEPLTDPVAVQDAVTRTVRQHFGADRCYYCEIVGGNAVIQRADCAPGLPSVAGSYPLASFSRLQVVLQGGQPFVVTDVHTDPGMDEDMRQLCLRLQIISYLDVPVIKQGRAVGVLCLVQSTPREWTESEINLAAEVAERTWSAVERARAEDALRQSEEQFRTVTNLVPDLLWRSDAQGERIWYNQRWYEYTGQTPEEAAGSGWTAVIHPDDRVQSVQHYQAAMRSGQLLRLEHRLRAAASDTYRWFQVQVRPIRNEAGAITQWFGAATDIHQRKLAEEAIVADNAWLEREVAERTRALQESTELLQSIYDTSLIGMSVLLAERDAAGVVQDFRIAVINRELARETGRTDLVGKRYKQEYPGIVPSGLFGLMLRALETGEPQQIEYYYPYDGFQKWFSATFVKLADRDGLAASNLDITERKRAEEAHLKNFTLLQQSEEAARLGSWEYDLPTKRLHWSAGMYGLFGLPAGSSVGPDTYRQAAAPDSRPTAERLIHRLQQGLPLDETLRIQVGNDTRTLRIKSVVVPDEQGRPARVLGVDVDISDLLRLQTENLQLHLQQQQQLFDVVLEAQEAERRRIAESLHNGVGQTLYATKLQLAQLRAAAPPSGWEHTDALLADAIRQTRALSHELVPAVLHEFGLAAALADICRTLSGPQLHFHCQIELEAALAQPLQVALYRMAQELAQNIVKHARASEATLALETVPGYVLLRAEDNGVGFAPAAPAGLGLRSIRDRVALLGGTVDLGSAELIGTYVRIRLPLP